ncbi:MAG: hypothetical protein ACFFB0_13150 [Promethearchaeota archaeon]
MKNYDKPQYDANYEEEYSIPPFFSKVKAEYLNTLSKVYIMIILLIILYLMHQFLISLYTQIYLKMVLNQILTWSFFFIYIVLHSFLLSHTKFCPTLLKYLKKELNYLGFKAQRKFKADFNFLVFVILSIIFLIFINFGFYLSSNYYTTSLIIRLVIIYMILGISIPILRGLFHDTLIVIFRKSYYIKLEIQIKLIKRKEIESQMVRIYMVSNKLSLKSDPDGFNLYKEISEKRWLPRKGRFTLPSSLYNPNLYLREYSTPINFKEHFLNLVSAIREWDLNYKSNI